NGAPLRGMKRLGWFLLSGPLLAGLVLVGACDDGAATQASSATGGGGSGGGSGGNADGDPPATTVPLDDRDDCDPELEVEGVSGIWYAYNATCEGMTGEQVPPAECTGE